MKIEVERETQREIIEREERGRENISKERLERESGKLNRKIFKNR